MRRNKCTFKEVVLIRSGKYTAEQLASIVVELSNKPIVTATWNKPCKGSALCFKDATLSNFAIKDNMVVCDAMVHNKDIIPSFIDKEVVFSDVFDDDGSVNNCVTMIDFNVMMLFV